MTDDRSGIIFMFFQKFFCSRKAIWLMYFSTSSRVIPIPLSDTVKVPASLSAFTRTLKLEASPLNFSRRCQYFQFLCSIYCIRHYFTKKNFMIRIEKLLKIGNKFCVDTPIFPVAIVYLFFSFKFKFTQVNTQLLCQKNESDKRQPKLQIHSNPNKNKIKQLYTYLHL